jgi:hypothetical protein
MSSPEFIHLAGGPAQAGSLCIVLRRIRRFECVVGVSDNLAVGPLHDVDSDAKARIAWWDTMHSDPFGDHDPSDFDEREMWQGLRDTGSNVVVWHGPNAIERLFALRACWHLRDHPERLFEVTLEPHEDLFIAVGVVPPAQLVAAWEQRAPVPDVAARAARWQQIRDTSGDWIRTLEDNEIVQHPLDVYDPAILEGCKGDWANSIRVIGHVLAYYHAPGDGLIRWRIAQMLDRGVLEGRGDSNRYRLPAEVRPSNKK